MELLTITRLPALAGLGLLKYFTGGRMQTTDLSVRVSILIETSLMHTL